MYIAQLKMAMGKGKLKTLLAFSRSVRDAFYLKVRRKRQKVKGGKCI